MAFDSLAPQSGEEESSSRKDEDKDKNKNIEKDVVSPHFPHVTAEEIEQVLSLEEDRLKDAELVHDALNQGIMSFVPDLIFEHMVKDYRLAEHIFGESLLRRLSGYSSATIKKNIILPEFQKKLKKEIEERVEGLRQSGLVDSQDMLTEKAVELSSLLLYTNELDKLASAGFFGERMSREKSVYGAVSDVRPFSSGDRYRDIALKASLKTAIRRGHPALLEGDLRSVVRREKGHSVIVYALDASASMKGAKIAQSKKVGVGLAYKAVGEHDKVGLLVFNAEVTSEISPTLDFMHLLREITRVRTGQQTNIAHTISRAQVMLASATQEKNRHIILITDAVPTHGKEPEKDTLAASAAAAQAGITISLVGIKLDAAGSALAQKIVKLGRGKLYVVKDLEELDKVVLEDYYALGQD
ncbi:hypothetical protein COY95_05290 [Candidatus Woesearchaeota archaeon CG_4_10_14_0_8_um_filter_47_5]|nr:MAG: hypothetical protein COY95_05290 [Candidatus Woesearchaeota archaeon CG_4_10_14_0_8_um_filter_47_5]